jgi:hypothetical protein
VKGLCQRAFVVVALCLFVGTSARAEWRRMTDVNYNTAYTLEEEGLEIGLLSPLTVGVTDELQVAIHPVLLLLSQPNIAIRWRVTQEATTTLALNLAASWSFIRKVDAEDRSTAAEGVATGFPGTLQLTAVTSIRLGENWLLSGSTGPAVDFLSDRAIRALATVHAGIHWLINEDQLLMLQGQTSIQLTDGLQTRRTSGELVYAVGLSRITHLAIGVGVGRFVFETSDSQRDVLNVFPVVDLWFRL